jgi:hypothetical protein
MLARRPARFALDRPLAAVVIAGLCLAAIYASYTGAADRNPDAGPHMLYVRYVAEQHALPAKAACNVCHHPPAYYLLAAVVYRASTALGVAEPAFGLQLLALALFAIFLAGAALTVKRLLPGDDRRAVLARVTALSLVAFWPSSILNSVRVGNDAMLYAISGGVLALLARWYQERSPRVLAAAAALVALGLFTKANAVALLAILLAVLGLALAKSPDRRALLRGAAPALGIVLAALALSVIRVRAPVGASPGDVLGNAYNIDAAWRTPRTARTYLTFDLASYLASPFASVSITGDGEPTFWNHLVKSSLFGTRRAVLESAPAEPIGIASAITRLLLALFAALLAGQALDFEKATDERRLAALAAAIHVLTAVGFHLVVPYGFHADFRFIYPAVVPLAILYAEGAARAGARKPIFFWIAIALAAAMAALSIAFFLPFTWNERPARRPVTIGDLSKRPAPAPSGSAPRLRGPILFR